MNEQCLEKIKSFRAENWNKKFFGGTVQKDQYEKAFKTAQQSWATLDKEYKSNKSSYDKVRLEGSFLSVPSIQTEIVVA